MIWCYLKKFFHLLRQEPLQVFRHIQRLHENWTVDRRGKLVNEVLSFSPNQSSITQCPRLALGLNCNQVICIHGDIERIAKHLGNAQCSIDLAMYTITSNEMSQALIAAANRGVRVRVITHSNPKKLILRFHGIPIRQVPLRYDWLMHNKFCVIDGYQSVRKLLPKGAKEPLTLCLTGSLNWVSYVNSYDNVLITSAPRVCQSMESEFENIWNISV